MEAESVAVICGSPPQPAFEARTEAPLLLSGIATASRDIDAIVRGLKDYARGEPKPEIEDAPQEPATPNAELDKLKNEGPGAK